MKKIFLAAALMMCTGLTAVFAGVPEINAKVMAAFKNQFSSATETEWSTGSDYYKASFLYNNNYVNAYYSLEGDFLATLRNISSVDLPVMLQASIKNDYADFWVSDLYEMSKQEGTSYYITLENADQKVVLKSSNGGAWTQHKKTGKV
jgi:hypothetical protein